MTTARPPPSGQQQTCGQEATISCLRAWGDRGESHTADDLLRANIVLVDIAEADGDRRTARQRRARRWR
jgi:hypothetical protein